MIPWRIVSAAAMATAFFISFYYVPSWRECVVIGGCWLVATTCNMRIGMLMGRS